MIDDVLRVGLVGAGRMGSDHAERLHQRISGARLVAVGDPDKDRASEAAGVVGCRAEYDPLTVIEASDVDAVVIASPGTAHEPLLLAAIDRGIPALCEKPLTPDSASSLRIVEAEVHRGEQLVQVGFMRRFDSEYVELKKLLDSGEMGRPLLVHNVHRNASSHSDFTTAMLITDSVVHEFDVTRWLLSEEIAAVSVRRPPPTSHAPGGVSDPQLVLIETASGVLVDVEIFVNCTYGYEVRCEAVCERGTATVGAAAGLVTRAAGRWGGAVAADFRPRFREAFDREFQRWVDAARRRAVDGATAWDGYAAAAVCEAGVEAQVSGQRVEVKLASRPDLYS